MVPDGCQGSRRSILDASGKLLGKVQSMEPPKRWETAVMSRGPGSTGGEVQDGVGDEMLGKPEDNGQLIVTSRSRDRVHNSRHTLLPVVRFSGLSGEHSVL